MPKAFFIDTSRCIACRGCQVACKEWHGLPAVPTRQRGTHQNPPDLNPFNYKLVRFTEEKIDGKVEWLFFPDQCHHCLDPSCKGAADSIAPGAIVLDKKTGAVICTDKTANLTVDQCKEIQESCPYNIPRRNEKTGLLTKCDMCIDRLRAEPAANLCQDLLHGDHEFRRTRRDARSCAQAAGGGEKVISPGPAHGPRRT